MNGWVDGYITNCNNGNPISGVLVTVDGTSGSSTTGSTGYYSQITQVFETCSPMIWKFSVKSEQSFSL